MKRVKRFLMKNGVGGFYYKYIDADTLQELTAQDIPLEAKPCCDCGCDGGDSTGGLDKLLAFDNDEEATTVAVGKYYTLASQNTYGLPEGIVKKKTA
jgi:hypothetical protein